MLLRCYKYLLTKTKRHTEEHIEKSAWWWPYFSECVEQINLFRWISIQCIDRTFATSNLSEYSPMNCCLSLITLTSYPQKVANMCHMSKPSSTRHQWYDQVTRQWSRTWSTYATRAHIKYIRTMPSRPTIVSITVNTNLTFASLLCSNTALPQKKKKKTMT